VPLFLRASLPADFVLLLIADSCYTPHHPGKPFQIDTTRGTSLVYFGYLSNMLYCLYQDTVGGLYGSAFFQRILNNKLQT
jgi:hypothetical protein